MNRLTRATAAAVLIILSGVSSAQNAESNPAPAPAPAPRGREVFQYWCAQCHGSGAGSGGTAALAYKYHGALPALLEERTDLTVEQVKFVVRHGANIMPFFRRIEISDAALDALAAYLTHAER